MSRRQAIEYLQLCKCAMDRNRKKSIARNIALYRLKRAGFWQGLAGMNPLTNAIDTFKNNKGGGFWGNLGLSVMGMNPLGMAYNSISGFMGGQGLAGLFNKGGNNASQPGTTAPSTSGSSNPSTDPSVNTTQPGTTAGG